MREGFVREVFLRSSAKPRGDWYKKHHGHKVGFEKLSVGAIFACFDCDVLGIDADPEAADEAIAAADKAAVEEADAKAAREKAAADALEDTVLAAKEAEMEKDKERKARRERLAAQQGAQQAP